MNIKTRKQIVSESAKTIESFKTDNRTDNRTDNFILAKVIIKELRSIKNNMIIPVSDYDDQISSLISKLERK